MKTNFECDPQKAEKNNQKHGVTFAEASSVFDDPMFITLLDNEHPTKKNALSQLVCPTRTDW